MNMFQIYEETLKNNATRKIKKSIYHKKFNILNNTISYNIIIV